VLALVCYATIFLCCAGLVESDLNIDTLVSNGTSEVRLPCLFVDTGMPW
jgi:hypothetical protein